MSTPAPIHTTAQPSIERSAPQEEEEDDVVGGLPTRRSIQAAITQRGSQADKTREFQIKMLEMDVKSADSLTEFERVMHEHFKLSYEAEVKRSEGWRRHAEELQRKLDEAKARKGDTGEMGTQTDYEPTEDIFKGKEEEIEETDGLGALPVVQSLSAQAKDRKRKTLREKKLEAVIAKQRDQITRLVAALGKTTAFMHDYNVRNGNHLRQADAEAAVAPEREDTVERIVKAPDAVQERPVASTSILLAGESAHCTKSASNSSAENGAATVKEEDDIVGALPTARRAEKELARTCTAENRS